MSVNTNKRVCNNRFTTILNQRPDNILKMENTTSSQEFQNIIEKLYTQIHDLPLSWLGKDISMKSGGIKLLWAQPSPASEMQVCVFHM